MNAAKDDGQKDNDHDVIIKQTYYERGEEELDYNDDAPIEEDMAVWDDGDPGDKDKSSNADDEEEDDLTEDHTAAESVHPQKGKDAPVWGWLGTPVGGRSTGLMRDHPNDEISPDWKSRWGPRGHSSDSSRSSCRQVASGIVNGRRKTQGYEPTQLTWGHDRLAVTTPEAD